MRKYSPTALNTFARYCPKALAFYIAKRGDSNDKEFSADPAESGIGFHYCTYQYALAIKDERDPEKALEAAATALASKGNAELVRAAADSAKEFCKWWEFPAHYQYEYGIAFDKNWKQTEWDAEDRRIRMIFDAVGMSTVQVGEYEMKVAFAQDYKTGWVVNKEMLTGVQMSAQTVALYEMYGDKADALQVEIVGTRGRRVYSEMYILNDDEHVAKIERCRKLVDFCMDAADKSDLSPRVGPRCVGCDFSEQCDAFLEKVKQVKAAGYDKPVDMNDARLAARDLAVLEEMVKLRRKDLSYLCGKFGPIEVDERELGYHSVDRRVVADPACLLSIIEEAFPDVDLSDNQKQILVSAFVSMKPGTTQLDNLIKKCAKQLGFKTQKAALEEMANKHVEFKPYQKFDWKKF